MSLSGQSLYAAVESLCDTVFAAEMQQHHKQITQLVARNNIIRGAAAPGFNYRGHNYGLQGLPGPVSSPPLAQELVPEIVRVLRFRQTIDLDRQIIRQAFSVLLAPCSWTQDIRDALPECVVALRPEYRTLSRTREPAYTIADNPRHMRMYEKALPKIETYVAMNIIY